MSSNKRRHVETSCGQPEKKNKSLTQLVKTWPLRFLAFLKRENYVDGTSKMPKKLEVTDRNKERKRDIVRLPRRKNE